MDVPWQQLSSDALRALVEELVTRDGTDYGSHEARFETKVEQVLDLIRAGKVKVVFDADTESVDLREARPAFRCTGRAGDGA
jgi:uncharacterized protein YheU (UPF0270 family)